MTYTVEVDWSPADELVMSLKAFLGRREHKTLDLGPDWAREVRRRLTPSLAARLSSIRVLEGTDLLDLLIRQCPERTSADAFVRWLAEPSPGRLYEWLAPFVPVKHGSELADLGGTRDRYVELLRSWNDEYFDGIEPEILQGLERDAAEKRGLPGGLQPDELVEVATSGVTLALDADLDRVWLVPQYHYRPWNVNALYRGVRCIYYPVDALPLAPGDISPRLRRLTRALSDESRLRILRRLTAGPAGFMEIVLHTGLSKSTVNHHVMILRAAGLVRVHDAGDRSTTYTLRPEAIDALRDDLHAYLS